MSGRVKGVQAQILKKNHLTTFSPCASHSLNLVGVHAAQSNPGVTTFFGCINRLYAFFSASPERWAIFTEKTGCSLHRLSDTRWSARIMAVKPVAKHLPSAIEAIDHTLKTCSLTNEARSEASGLKSYFMTFECIVLLTVWLKVLQCIDDRNLIIQSGKISLETEAANISALTKEMLALRSKWEALVSEATLVATQIDVEPQFRPNRRKMKRKRFHDETSMEETAQDRPETMFRNTVFFTAMDSSISDLDTRFNTTAAIVEEFSAVLKVGRISEDKVHSVCQSLIKKYSGDLTPDFENEIRHLNMLYAATFSPNLSPLGLLNAINKLQLQSIFGEVSIALRIFCTLPVTVAGGERAFSKLKLIKNYLRSTMSQDRLCNLPMLSIKVSWLES